MGAWGNALDAVDGAEIGRIVLSLSPGRLDGIAVLGAHCDDIAIGAGATLLRLCTAQPGIPVHALIFTGGGTEREREERQALTDFCPDAELSVTVLDFPDGRLPHYWDGAKESLRAFRRDLAVGIVFSPHSADAHQDHRTVADLVPTEFRDHWHLRYEILKWESDLGAPTVHVGADEDIMRRKYSLLAKHYPSQADKPWFDEEAFLGLARVRGVQCHSRYAEAFHCDKLMIDPTGVR